MTIHISIIEKKSFPFDIRRDNHTFISASVLNIGSKLMWPAEYTSTTYQQRWIWMINAEMDVIAAIHNQPVIKDARKTKMNPIKMAIVVNTPYLLSLHLDFLQEQMNGHSLFSIPSSVIIGTTASLAMPRFLFSWGDIEPLIWLLHIWVSNLDLSKEFCVNQIILKNYLQCFERRVKTIVFNLPPKIEQNSCKCNFIQLSRVPYDFMNWNQLSVYL